MSVLGPYLPAAAAAAAAAAGAGAAAGGAGGAAGVGGGASSATSSAASSAASAAAAAAAAAAGGGGAAAEGGALFGLGLLHCGARSPLIRFLLLSSLKEANNAAKEPLLHGGALGLSLVCLGHHDDTG